MKSRRPAGLHHFFANRVHLRFTAAAATVAVLVGTGLVSPLGAAAGDLDPTPALELEATQAFEAENTPVVEAGGTPGLETTPKDDDDDDPTVIAGSTRNPDDADPTVIAGSTRNPNDDNPPVIAGSTRNPNDNDTPTVIAGSTRNPNDNDTPPTDDDSSVVEAPGSGNDTPVVEAPGTGGLETTPTDDDDTPTVIAGSTRNPNDDDSSVDALGNDDDNPVVEAGGTPGLETTPTEPPTPIVQVTLPQGPGVLATENYVALLTRTTHLTAPAATLHMEQIPAAEAQPTPVVEAPETTPVIAGSTRNLTADPSVVEPTPTIAYSITVEPQPASPAADHAEQTGAGQLVSSAWWVDLQHVPSPMPLLPENVPAPEPQPELNVSLVFTETLTPDPANPAVVNFATIPCAGGSLSTADGAGLRPGTVPPLGASITLTCPVDWAQAGPLVTEVVVFVTSPAGSRFATTGVISNAELVTSEPLQYGYDVTATAPTPLHVTLAAARVIRKRHAEPLVLDSIQDHSASLATTPRHAELDSASLAATGEIAGQARNDGSSVVEAATKLKARTGDLVEYQTTITNTSTDPISNLAISNRIYAGSQAAGTLADQGIGAQPTCTRENGTPFTLNSSDVLQQGEQITCTTSEQVTDGHLQAEAITATAYATGISAVAGQVTSLGTQVSDNGLPTTGSETPELSLDITKLDPIYNQAADGTLTATWTVTATPRFSNESGPVQLSFDGISAAGQHNLSWAPSPGSGIVQDGVWCVADAAEQTTYTAEVTATITDPNIALADHSSAENTSAITGIAQQVAGVSTCAENVTGSNITTAAAKATTPAALEIALVAASLGDPIVINSTNTGITGATSTTALTTIPFTDADPGDGVCETVTGNGVCTLHAALMEANAQYAADNTITNIDITVDPSLNGQSIVISQAGTPNVISYPDTLIPGEWTVGKQRMYPNYLPPGYATPATTSLATYTGYFANPSCGAPTDSLSDTSAGIPIGYHGALFLVTAPVTLDFGHYVDVVAQGNWYSGDNAQEPIFALLGNNIEVKNLDNVMGTDIMFYVGPCSQNITLTDISAASPNYYAEQFLAIRGGASNITLQGTTPTSSTLSGLVTYYQADGYVVITGTNANYPVTNLTVNQINFASDGGTNCGAGAANSSVNAGTSCTSSILKANSNGGATKQYLAGDITLSNSTIQNLNRSSTNQILTYNRGIDMRAATITGTLNITNNQFVTPGWRTSLPVIDFTGTNTVIANFNIADNDFTGMSQATGSADASQTGGAAIMLGGSAATPLVPAGGQGIIADNSFQWTGTTGPNAIYWTGGQTASPSSTASNVFITDNAFNWPTTSANAGIRLYQTGFVTMSRNTFASGSASQASPAVPEETADNAALLVDNYTTSANAALQTWYPTATTSTSVGSITTAACSASLQLSAPTGSASTGRIPVLPASVDVYWTAGNDAEVYLGNYPLPAGVVSPTTINVAIPWNDGTDNPQPSSAAGVVTGFLRVQTQDPNVPSNSVVEAGGTPGLETTPTASSQYSRLVSINGTGCVEPPTASVSLLKGTGYDGTIMSTGAAPFSDGSTAAVAAGLENEPNDDSTDYTPGEDGSGANDVIRTNDLLTATWNVGLTGAEAATDVLLDFTQTLTPDPTNPAVVNFAVIPSTAVCDGGTPYITAYDANGDALNASGVPTANATIQPKTVPPAGTVKVVLTCPISTQVGQANLITTQAWVANTSPNGSLFSTTAAVMPVDTDAVTAAQDIEGESTDTYGDFTVSAAPRWDLQKGMGQQHDGCGTQAVGATTVECDYAIFIVTDRAAGVEALTEPITFTEEFFATYVSDSAAGATDPNGAVGTVIPDFEWTITGCENMAQGGIGKNQLASLFQGTSRSADSTAPVTCTYDRTDPDDKTSPYQITVSDVDFNWYPTQTDNAYIAMPVGQYYVASFGIFVTFSADAVDAADGDPDDTYGALNAYNIVSGFDPAAPDGTPNFGVASGGEPGYCPESTDYPYPAGTTATEIISACKTTTTALQASNNVDGPYTVALSHYTRSGASGAKAIRNRTQPWNWAENGVHGATDSNGSNGVIQPGETNGNDVDFSNNSNAASNFYNTGVEFCDVFDNSMAYLAPLSDTIGGGLESLATDPNMVNPYVQILQASATADYNKALTAAFSYKFAHVDLSDDNPNLGLNSDGSLNSTQFNVATGRWNGSWNNQSAAIQPATNVCSSPNTVWFDDPNEVPGGIDEVNVVWAYATDPDYQQPPSTWWGMTIALTQRATFYGGPHNGLTIPSGTYFTNFGAVESNQDYQNWGGRWEMQETVVRSTAALKSLTVKTTYDGGEYLNTADGAAAIDTNGTAVAGDPITWQLNTSITSTYSTTTPATGVVVTATLPAGVTLNPSDTNALNSANTYTSVDSLGNPVPDTPIPSVSYTENSNGTTTLTWDLGSVLPNTVIGVCGDLAVQPAGTTTCGIQIATTSIPTLEGNTSLVLTAKINADGIPVLSEMTDTHTVVVSSPQTLIAYKAVDHNIDPVDDTQIYTLTVLNNTQLELTNPVIYDVLPYVGDGPMLAADAETNFPPSDYHGTNKLTAPPTANVPGTFCYWLGALGNMPTTLDIDIAQSAKGGNSDPNAAQDGCDSDAAWTSVYSTAATGFKFISSVPLDPPGGANHDIVIDYTLAQQGNLNGDWYVNRFNLFSDTLENASDGSHIKYSSAETLVQVLSYVLGDLIWADANTVTQPPDGVYAPNSADRPLPGVSLTVYSVGPNGVPDYSVIAGSDPRSPTTALGDDLYQATATTDENGRWTVTNLPPGQYYAVIGADMFASGAPLAGLYELAPSLSEATTDTTTCPTTASNPVLVNGAWVVEAGGTPGLETTTLCPDLDRNEGTANNQDGYGIYAATLDSKGNEVTTLVGYVTGVITLEPVTGTDATGASYIVSGGEPPNDAPVDGSADPNGPPACPDSDPTDCADDDTDASSPTSLDNSFTNLTLDISLAAPQYPTPWFELPLAASIQSLYPYVLAGFVATLATALTITRRRTASRAPR